jgi:transcriptional regulator with XRE-family HTH domain
MNIVERIKWLAEKQGINIKTLEKTVGLGNATIRGWEKSSPRCDKLYLIAQHFDVSMEWLLTGKEEKELSNEDKLLLNAYHSANEEAKEIVKFTLEISRKTNKKLEMEKSSISKTG